MVRHCKSPTQTVAAHTAQQSDHHPFLRSPSPHAHQTSPTLCAQSTAEELKQAGNAAFREGRFGESVRQFTSAIDLLQPQGDRTLFSNRSGALAALGRYTEALADADQAISLDLNWAKGYSRKGAALYGLGRYDEALSMYEAGLTVDPSNVQIEQAASEVRQKIAGARQLLAAASSGSLEQVRACLGAGVHADGMMTPEGATPLIVAAEAGHAEVVAELLAARADAQRMTRIGDTALALARRSGHDAAMLSSLEVAMGAGGEGGAAGPASWRPGGGKASGFFGKLGSSAKDLAERSRLMAEKTRAAAEVYSPHVLKPSELRMSPNTVFSARRAADCRASSSLIGCRRRRGRCS